MVESQPGTVVSFNPSVTLSNFSASTRDRFMFNENQLVLAKLVRPLITYAAGYGVTFGWSGGMLTRPYLFEQYVNSDGQFVYADDLFYLSDAAGVPTVDVAGIVVGFDFQVSSSTFKFWSVTYVDSNNLSLDYSFDGDTWFAVSNLSWSYAFDDTLQLYEGESPATGQYVYTGTFTGVSARYWRLKSQGITTTTVQYTSGTTVTVSSTTGFPSSGNFSTVNTSTGAIVSTWSYTGKTSTTFTGVSGGSSTPAGSLVIGTGATLIDAYLSNVTEVRVLQTTQAILEHWNSDGSQAVSVVVDGSKFYDICYDAFDDVYYAIYFNESPTQTDPIDPDDNFNTAFAGDAFDSAKWIESETFPYFVHNTISGTLDMVSGAGAGMLQGNYGIDGGYVATIDLVSVMTTNSGTAFCLAAEDFDTGNQEMVVGLKGIYSPPSVSSDFVGATITYSDTIGAAAALRNFRIKPHFFNFADANNLVSYTMAYDSANDRYSVAVDGVADNPAYPGVPYENHSCAFTISNVYTPADGQGFTVNVACDRTATLGTSVSGIYLEIERLGTTGYAKYRDTATPGVTKTVKTGTITSARHRPYIFGHPGSSAPIIRADNYVVTSGTVHYATPVFTVAAIDKDGQMVSVSNVTDGSGYVIKNLDIIRDPQAGYNDFIYPYTGIATNGAAYNAGGEIYIKVGDKLMKYAKAAALPITHEPENLPTATVVTEGEIPANSITAFAYNGFSQAGLSYIKYEDSLGGVFLKTINTSDLLANNYKAKLDVASINYPFAWNVSDLSTLYYVDGTALKLYDLNETKAAFVNVSSDKQVLAAGTAQTATVTAQVLNVYGIPKSAKTMTFSVSAGDGAISPATGCSNNDGEDTTTYTVGSAVGTATITVSVSDTTCTP